jgi:DNA-directed RNA polymerase specialized sigma24 family protein
MGMATVSSSHPRRSLLADAAIHASLRRAIASRVPAQEVEDLAQATLLEAHAAADAPEERAAFERWLNMKGRSNAIDFLRRRGRHARWMSGEDVDDAPLPAASAQDAYDARDGLRFAQAHLEARGAVAAGDSGAAAQARARSVRWLLLRLRGESLESIAVTEGVQLKTVSVSVKRLQRNLHAAWLAVAAIVVVWILRGLFGRNPHEEQAHPLPAPSMVPAPPVPSATPGPPPPTPEEKLAHDLRERALRECDAGKWGPCLEDLDRAYELDPAGEWKDPQVDAARTSARKHLPPEKP